MRKLKFQYSKDTKRRDNNNKNLVKQKKKVVTALAKPRKQNSNVAVQGENKSKLLYTEEPPKSSGMGGISTSGRRQR